MNNIGCKSSVIQREKKTQMVVWAELVITLELKQCDVSYVVTVIKLFTS